MKDLIKEGCYKALKGLYIAVEEEVATDVNEMVFRYIHKLEKQITSLIEEKKIVVDTLNILMESFPTISETIQVAIKEANKK